MDAHPIFEMLYNIIFRTGNKRYYINRPISFLVLLKKRWRKVWKILFAVFLFLKRFNFLLAMDYRLYIGNRQSKITELSVLILNVCIYNDKITEKFFTKFLKERWKYVKVFNWSQMYDRFLTIIREQKFIKLVQDIFFSIITSLQMYWYIKLFAYILIQINL